MANKSLKMCKIELLWEIPKFSHLMDTYRQGKRYKSNSYHLEGELGGLISLEIIPYANQTLSKDVDRRRKTAEKWTSLFFFIDTGYDTDNWFHIEVAILNDRGDTISKSCHKKMPQKELGYPQFIRRSVLENPANKLLTDDILTVSIYINELTGDDSEKCDCISEPTRIIRARRQMAKDLRLLLDKGTNADVELVVKSRKMHAHKAILSARSSVFAAMFQHRTEEGRTGQVIIDDIEANVFQELLRYIYTGDSEKLESLAEGLLVAADKYHVPDLKDSCEEELHRKLDKDNAIRYLILADLHAAKNLKENVIRFINDNAAEVMNKRGWGDLVKSHSHLIADLYSDLVFF